MSTELRDQIAAALLDDGWTLPDGSDVALADFILALPAVRLAFARSEAIDAEAMWDEPTMDFQMTTRAVQRGHNELLARLRAVGGES